MEETTQINNLSEVLHLPDEEIISHSTSYLTKPGENYGSTMLSLKVKSRSESLGEREVALVAKMIPPNEILLAMFQTQLTFKKENRMYQVTVPALKQLQRDRGIPEVEIIDCYPKYYGSRISLQPESTVVDADAVLLLEDLRSKAYVMCDRMQGFDEATAMVILKNLAEFHALPIALRRFRPEEFREKVMPTLRKINMYESMGDDTVFDFIQNTNDAIEKIEEMQPYIKKIHKALLEDITYQKNPPEAREPFATFVHNDFWVNNILVKYDANKRPTNIKILDYQICMYESLVHDLLFFIFTSVQDDVVLRKYNSLIIHYYTCFTGCLKRLDCDMEEFSFQKFEEEIDSVAPKQFTHIIFMLKVLMARKEAAVDLKDYDPENFNKEDFVGPEYVVKMTLVIKEFVKRNWLL